MAQTRTFEIAGRVVGRGNPPFIIAELSGNHNGDLGRALALMTAAKEAGADAIKLQTYTADTLTIDHKSEEFRIHGGLWDNRYLYDLYQEASTPWEWHEALFAKGEELGITVFSTPFDETAVDLLEGLDVAVYKVASFEAMDIALVQKVARTGKPIIISTGMVDADEIEATLHAARQAGAGNLALLHCVSAYPAQPEDSNLTTILDLAQRFDVVSGLSDHTIGNVVAIAGVACGASIVEKHLTLRRGDGGPDAEFSLEPEEFTALVSACRTAWSAIGTVNYERPPGAKGNLAFRRSLYIVEDVKAGETLTSRNVRSIRPGYGLKPSYLPRVLGRKAAQDLFRGTALSFEMVLDWDGESDGRPDGG